MRQRRHRSHGGILYRRFDRRHDHRFSRRFGCSLASRCCDLQQRSENEAPRREKKRPSMPMAPSARKPLMKWPKACAHYPRLRGIGDGDCRTRRRFRRKAGGSRLYGTCHRGRDFCKRKIFSGSREEIRTGSSNTALRFIAQRRGYESLCSNPAEYGNRNPAKIKRLRKRWVQPTASKAVPVENLHITLDFWVKSAKRKKGLCLPPMLWRQATPFPLEIRGTGAFPKVAAPAMTWRFIRNGRFFTLAAAVKTATSSRIPSVFTSF